MSALLHPSLNRSATGLAPQRVRWFYTMARGETIPHRKWTRREYRRAVRIPRCENDDSKNKKPATETIEKSCGNNPRRTRFTAAMSKKTPSQMKRDLATICAEHGAQHQKRPVASTPASRLRHSHTSRPSSRRASTKHACQKHRKHMQEQGFVDSQI